MDYGFINAIFQSTPIASGGKKIFLIELISGGQQSIKLVLKICPSTLSLQQIK